MIKEDLEFKTLPGSHHCQKPSSVDTQGLFCGTEILYTVTEKYFTQWERNTLYYNGSKILWEINTFYCEGEILYTVQGNYFISPPPPNISIWKAGSQKFSHHFYLGHSWKQLQTNKSKRNCVFISKVAPKLLHYLQENVLFIRFHSQFRTPNLQSKIRSEIWNSHCCSGCSDAHLYPDFQACWNYNFTRGLSGIGFWDRSPLS